MHAGPPTTDPMIGRRFGSHVVVRLLGKGGMGAVYVVQHETLVNKPRVVKVLLPEVAAMPGLVERFFQEARAAAAIEHPAIIDIIDCGRADDGTPFIIMPFLAGSDLDAFCDEVGARHGHPGRLPVELVLPIFLPICDALRVAHASGIIHRDLKGANLFVLTGHTGELTGIKILDFGIAKLQDPSLRLAHKTASFAVFGTPGYMSPEQARGQPVDERTDIYALGVILYRALTGQLPFSGSDPVDIAVQAITTVPPAPATLAPAIPAELSAAILSALAPRPEDRPTSVTDLASLLIGSFPDGVAVAERVAPGLLHHAQPGDRTVRVAAPVSGAPPTAPRPRNAAAVPPMTTPMAAAVATPPPTSAGARGRTIAAIAAVAVVAAAIVAAFALRGRGDRAGAAVAADAGAAVADRAGEGPSGASAADAAGPDPAGSAPAGSGAEATAALTPDAAVPDAAQAAALVDAGVRRDRPVRTEPEGTGTLIVTAAPWAEVSIGGGPVETTPVTRELKSGRHAVKLTRPDGKTETVRITIRPGETTRISRDWKRSP